MSDRPSPPELAALAWRLTDAALVHNLPEHALLDEDERADADRQRERVVDLMTAGPDAWDEIAARDAYDAGRERAPDDVCAAAELTDALFSWDDGRPVIRLDDDTARLLFIVAQDALVPVFMARHGAAADPASLGWPTLLPGRRSGVDPCLDQPSADLHVHLGGTLAPGTLWMMALADHGPALQAIRASQTEQLRWNRRMNEAAGCLFHPREPSDKSRQQPFIQRLPALLLRFADRLPPFDPDADPALATVALGRAHADARSCRRVHLLTLIERAVLLEAWGQPTRRADVVAYLRVRNAHHRRVLVGPGPRGLHRFRRGLDESKLLFAGAHAGQRRFEQALQLQTHLAIDAALADASPRVWTRSHPSDDWRVDGGESIRPFDLELRVPFAPARRLRSDLMARLRGVADAMDGWPKAPFRVGFLFHLSKTDGAPDLPRPLALEEASLHHVEALLDLLRAEPELRPFVIGLDAAGAELEAAPRTLASAFALARHALNDPHHRLHPSGGPPARLGFTFHAGEDFRDLLTGVRHVEEASRLLGMRPGDRIGHALAVAWDPGDFYRRRGRTWPRLGDHLLDLVWAYGILHRGTAEEVVLAHRAQDRVAEALTRAQLPFDGARFHRAVVDTDIEGHHLRLTPRLSGGVEDLHKWRERAPHEHTLLTGLGVSETVSKRTVQLDATSHDWWVFVRACQEAVRRRLEERSVVIEANPTSNLIVGGFSTYSELPYHRFNDVHLRHPPTQRLRLTLNSDDPGVFQTTLRNELRHMFRALQDQGHSPSAIAAWLNATREEAVRSTFIPHHSPRGPMLRAALRQYRRDTADDSD